MCLGKHSHLTSIKTSSGREVLTCGRGVCVSSICCAPSHVGMSWMLLPPSLPLPVNKKEALGGFQINLSLSMYCVLPKSTLHFRPAHLHRNTRFHGAVFSARGTQLCSGQGVVCRRGRPWRSGLSFRQILKHWGKQAALLVWSVHSTGLKVGVFGVQRWVVSRPHRGSLESHG